MDRLWAPWRFDYIAIEQPQGCIFCVKSQATEDEKNHILWRGEKVFMLLNTFPYNTGHLMVAPYRHTGDALELSPEEGLELFHGVKLGVSALKEVFKPQGFNIGSNVGQVAGAGFADHLHVHVVPRWSGDTNFMAVLNDTRVVPQALATTYEKLKEALQGLIS
jgi:ATP adenylyltransferase